MTRIVFAVLAAGCVLAMGAVSQAQLIAFPGAEGAAQFASGGRGTPGTPGDVYIVTTLADYDPDDDNTPGSDQFHPNDAIEPAIVGSLRHGILTAPAAGRTIVFAVDGTINLHDSLRTDGRDNITIAGQTAPGGGITLAKHDLNINGSENIVIQHIRSRPGDRFAASHPNPAWAPAPLYNADAVWVSGSNNVMLDHITASWGPDETVSVTNSSDLVTVQWSTITQGLFNAGHSDEDGIGHSYGSLLNGNQYSFHHNLYAHSKARHPRPQFNSGGPLLELDWVNNVIYNPRDDFGNSDSDDPYSINMVGNYGVKGPQSGSGNSFMMDPQDTDSTFYVEGNFMDTDRDLLLDGGGVDEAAVFQTGRPYTIVPDRFEFPQVVTHTAEQAYIQVLSRAGANFYRDPVDRRTIRTVLNNLPGQIDTQVPWGGHPALPSGTPEADSNSDGVPDSWAISQGKDINLPLNAEFDEDGYTYLEKYIHSLTPSAYTPTGTVEHTIRTNFGNGADAYVTENGGGSATSGGNGTGNSLDAGFSTNVNQAIVMRFDVSELVPGSITEARLDLTASSAISGTHNFMIYALEQDNSRWNWDESTVQFSDAPGLVFDSNSATLGINNTFTTTNHPDNAGVLTLGQVSIPSAVAGQTISLTNPNLAVFLNLAAYYQGGASEDAVTLILQQIASATTANFYSKEGSAEFAPRLVVNGLLAPVVPPPFFGDFNDDEVVDAADYTVWRNNLGTNFDLGGNGDEAGGSMGIVDEADYELWRANYGNVVIPGGGGLANNQVPEPASGVLLLLGSLFAVAARRRIAR